MTDYKITETEKAAHHLQALADRPNAMTSYKRGKLSADGMKKLFDDNFDFVSDKHNKLGEALEAEHDDRVMKHDALEEKHDELAAEHDALEAKHNELEKSHEKTAAQVETLIGEPINRIWPIGAVYISFNKQDPAELFGGTWTAIASDKFLMTTKSTSGTNGGSKFHNHAIGEARANAYFDESLSSLMYATGFTTDSGGIFQEYNTNEYAYFGGGLVENFGEGSSRSGIKVEGNTASTNTLPPYITVFMWRRIA